MTLKSILPRPWLTLLFVALILITRTNSSSTILDTPDATLGVFFLAGLWAPAALTFGLMFGACMAADLLSFQLGVSDWCFTPAYVFLVPTYASLWYAGFLCRKLDITRFVDLAKIAVSLTIACAVAYFISSESFLLFGGRYPATLTSIEYWTKILPHFPHYSEWAFGYTAMGLIVAAAAKRIGYDVHSSTAG